MIWGRLERFQYRSRPCRGEIYDGIETLKGEDAMNSVIKSFSVCDKNGEQLWYNSNGAVAPSDFCEV